MKTALSAFEEAFPEANILALTNYCKGIAMVWIFLVHYQGGWFGWQGVHIFIVLSGFGLTYSCLNRQGPIHWGQWYLKRLRRVLPAYWLAIFISLAIVVTFQLSNGNVTRVPFIRTGLNLLMMTNVFEQFRGGPTGALWFVPFIVGAYLIFPCLYNLLTRFSRWRGCLLLLLVTILIEFSYRAFAIYHLDGLPISYDNQRFLAVFPNMVSPLNQHADWLFGLLQRRAPFGFIPARIGEFALGMVAAFGLIRNRQLTNRWLLNPYTGLAGILIWLAGQALLYVGLWGWVLADFVIALGLTLWTLNLAYVSQKWLPKLFAALTFIGVWSYYIYLIHQPFTRGARLLASLFTEFDIGLFGDILLHMAFLGLATLLTLIFSWPLITVDRSKWVDTLFARFEQPLRAIAG